ncbi:MAG TPA: DUF3606 domain-containing protein [Burkholderiales bacterium]|nr:DUF3606 domain-containing protein [Burkholderiales bacterium]
MSDESKVGRDRIDLEQDDEVREWYQSHGVTEDDVRNAVTEVQSFMAMLEILVDHRTDAHTATQAREVAEDSSNNK